MSIYFVSSGANGCNANLERNSDVTTTKLVHVEEIKKVTLLDLRQKSKTVSQVALVRPRWR